MATAQAKPGDRTSEHWHIRAEEARAAAGQMSDPENRAMMLVVARHYDVLAVHSDPEARSARLLQLLGEAQDHVERGARHVREQRALIARLMRDGHETGAAQRLLDTFEETQLQHEGHRDQLQAALAGHAYTAAAAALATRAAARRPHKPR